MASATVAFFATAIFAAAFATAAFATTALAATASTSHVLDERCHFVVSSRTVFYDVTVEAERHASVGVVGVDGDAVVLNFRHAGHELVTLDVIKCDDSSFVDVLIVELAIDLEDLALQFVYTFLVIGTEGLLGLQVELKFLSCLNIDNVLLQCVQRGAKTTDKLERVLGRCLLQQCLLTVLYLIQLVVQRNKLVLFLIHVLYIIMYVAAKVQRSQRNAKFHVNLINKKEKIKKNAYSLTLVNKRAVCAHNSIKKSCRFQKSPYLCTVKTK